ncbi:MAG: DUF4038 domain-containing protein [Deltaproteobacteria bacterium]|nr:DUF4038 domain-containing protein [Deltaproteobacteria bacterium]
MSQKLDIKFESKTGYKNPYTDVELWVQLTGPNFKKKVWGFWDGGKTFKVRVVATEPGVWSWVSHANVKDSGLAGRSGIFKAIAQTKEEISENPNRRGFIRTNPNAPHSFIYDDGTPFFLLADTWWSAMTWRYPYKGGKYIPEDYVPNEQNWCFEGGIQWLKKHGYNSIALIASFPNWKIDDYGRVVQDDNGIYIRKAESWGKAPLGEKVKDMHDEDGNMPFFFPGKCKGKSDACANYDKLNPAYWQNMDKKMDYLWKNGIVPSIETIRRDQLPVWVYYHDFNQSFARYLNYIKARYGAYNFIYSLVHWDTNQPGVTIDDLKGAFSYYHLKYGAMPFGQPVTAMAGGSSANLLGHIDAAPYLTCHSAGNTNRGHGILARIEEFYHLEPLAPGYNNEPYYPMHDVPWGRVGRTKRGGAGDPREGEDIISNSPRDNYLGRTHMYSNFFSGAFGGHVFGTGAFGGDSVGEPPYVGTPADWPKIWEALNNDALKQGQFFKKFVDSQGENYQNLILAYNDLSEKRNKSDVLDEWSYMLKSPDNKIVLLYFENLAKQQTISNLPASKEYASQWYNPRTGEWTKMGNGRLKTDKQGKLKLPKFPSGKSVSQDDWAARLTSVEFGY